MTNRIMRLEAELETNYENLSNLNSDNFAEWKDISENIDFLENLLDELKATNK